LKQYIQIQVTIQKKKVSLVRQRRILVQTIHANVILPLLKSLLIFPTNMTHLSTWPMVLTIQQTVRPLVALEVVRKKSMIVVVSTQ